MSYMSYIKHSQCYHGGGQEGTVTASSSWRPRLQMQTLHIEDIDTNNHPDCNKTV